MIKASGSAISSPFGGAVCDHREQTERVGRKNKPSRADKVPERAHAVNPNAKALGAMRNFSGVLKPSPGRGKVAANVVSRRMRAQMCSSFSSVDNHRLCTFSTPGFSPGRFVENCPG